MQHTSLESDENIKVHESTIPLWRSQSSDREGLMQLSIDRMQIQLAWIKSLGHAGADKLSHLLYLSYYTEFKKRKKRW